jgi:hypothetical protein
MYPDIINHIYLFNLEILIKGSFSLKNCIEIIKQLDIKRHCGCKDQHYKPYVNKYFIIDSFPVSYIYFIKNQCELSFGTSTENIVIEGSPYEITSQYNELIDSKYQNIYYGVYRYKSNIPWQYKLYDNCINGHKLMYLKHYVKFAFY